MMSDDETRGRYGPEKQKARDAVKAAHRRTVAAVPVPVPGATGDTGRPACDHHESLYGRCAACGVTWEQQAAAGGVGDETTRACERCGKVHDEPLCDDEMATATAMQLQSIAAREGDGASPSVTDRTAPAAQVQTASTNATFTTPLHCTGERDDTPCEWGRFRVHVGDTTLPDIEVWGYEDAYGLFCYAHGGFGGSVRNAPSELWLQDMSAPAAVSGGERSATDEPGGK